MIPKAEEAGSSKLPSLENLDPPKLDVSIDQYGSVQQQYCINCYINYDHKDWS